MQQNQKYITKTAVVRIFLLFVLVAACTHHRLPMPIYGRGRRAVCCGISIKRPTWPSFAKSLADKTKLRLDHIALILIFLSELNGLESSFFLPLHCVYGSQRSVTVSRINKKRFRPMHTCSIGYILKSFSRVSCPVLAYCSSFAGVYARAWRHLLSLMQTCLAIVYLWAHQKLQMLKWEKWEINWGKPGDGLWRSLLAVTDGRSHGGGEKETKTQASL